MYNVIAMAVSLSEKIAGYHKTTIQLFHTKLISSIPTNDWVKKLLFLQAKVDRILPRN